jgi:predicted O-linked N-acetylglucosamine transferase (SPINDLY family)
MTNDTESRLAEQFARAQTLQRQGQPAAARQVYQEILDARADHADALIAMGVLAAQSQDLHQAIQYFDRAIAAEPGNSGAHCNRGVALRQIQQPQAALASFDRAIALDPKSAIAHYSRAEIYTDLGRIDEAIAGYGEAVALNPGFLPAAYKRGFLLQRTARLADAVASYDQVLRLKPDHFEAQANKAFSLFDLGRHAEALPSCEQAIAQVPGEAKLHLLRGDLLRGLGQPAPALSSYERAISINPNDAEAHYSRGVALLQLEKLEAIACFDKAIEIRPEYADAYYRRGYSRHKLRQFDLAAADYKTAAALAPNLDFLLGSRLETGLQACDWSEFEPLVAQITAGAEKGARVSEPFTCMAFMDSPRMLHEVARTWVDYICPVRDAVHTVAPRERPRKLVVGYFSSDFRPHPVANVLAGVIEHHDRTKFELIAFAFGPESSDPIVARLTKAFDRFIDVRSKSNLEVIALARELKLDIAVDLNGFTTHCRPQIFAGRAAPIQINFLGYPGTMGAGFMDYLIADRTVVPQEQRVHYSEKIVYMPDTFMPFDSTYEIADRPFARKELGLPSTGFVFCCFNNSYKIIPEVFDRWMRILSRTGNSVLWLRQANDAIVANLRKEATRRGVDGGRLIFAERTASLPEHLARLRAADLFIDTFPYTAHATTLDALWAGVPLLTYAGDGFASRVAASLLTALGTPELIASTQQDYERLAIELASNPLSLAEIRTRVRNQRQTSPLFDTPRFAQNLESAYATVHDRYRSGLAPDHLSV